LTDAACAQRHQIDATASHRFAASPRTSPDGEDASALDILVKTCRRYPGGSIDKSTRSDWSHAWELKVLRATSTDRAIYAGIRQSWRRAASSTTLGAGRREIRRQLLLCEARQCRDDWPFTSERSAARARRQQSAWSEIQSGHGRHTTSRHGYEDPRETPALARNRDKIPEGHALGRHAHASK